MSSSSYPSSITSCCVCQEVLKEPIRTLPCLHSACFPCLEKLVSSSKKKKDLRCPRCRAGFQVPDGGLVAMPINYFTSHLLASSAISSFRGDEDGDPKAIKCESCVHKLAAEYCLDCVQYYCPSCKSTHLKGAEFASHQFISLEGAMKAKEASSPIPTSPTAASPPSSLSRKFSRMSSTAALFHGKISHCQKHPQQEVNTYCERCKEACCTECAVDNHKNHNIERLSKVATQFKHSVTSMISRVKPYDAELAQAVKDTSETLTEVSVQAKTTDDQVRKVFEQLRAQLAEQEAELLREIELEKQHKEKELSLQKEELECLLKGVRHAVSFSVLLLKEGDATEIAANHQQVMTRFETLINEKEIHTQMEPITGPEIDLEGAEKGAKTVTDAIKTVGSIVTKLAISAEKSRVRREVAKSEIDLCPVNQNYTFDVILSDKKGERYNANVGGKKRPASIQLEVLVEGPSTDVKATITPGKEEGIRVITFPPNQVGEHQVSVLYAGKHFMGSPFKVKVTEKVDGPSRDFSETEEVMIRRLGSQGTKDSQFSSPYAVGSTTRGEVIVADTENHRAQAFDKDGKFLFKFGTFGKKPGQFASPCGMTVDQRNSNEIVIADTGNHRIQIFDEKGKWLRQFGAEGRGDGQFSSPEGIVIDPITGQYLVTDSYNHCVQVFTRAGGFVKKFGTKGNGNGQLNGPIGIGILLNGCIVVAEHGSHRLQVFDSSGNFVRVIGATPGLLKSPRHLYVDSSSNIFVADSGNNQVQVFNQSGNRVKVLGGKELSGPSGISMTPQGRILVTEFCAHRLTIC